MFTFIVVVAISAFVPYVATPTVVNGVKAISTPKAAPAAMQFDMSPATASDGNDATNRIVSDRRDCDASV